MKKIGIIGCGTIAVDGENAHVPCYLRNGNAEIRYFCNRNKEKAEACVEKFGMGKAVTDYREVLADPEVDAVSICTPNYLHARMSIDAMRAGKDVLCEKPAAMTSAEAEEMARVQKETGRILNIGVINRYNDYVNLMRDYIQKGKLGDIYHIYVSFRAYRSIPGLGGAFTTKALAGGGALIDWGVHYLDIALYCCGDPKPKTVSAESFCKIGVDMEKYVYRNMWSENTKNLEGTYDVDDSVVGLIRTDGPVITFFGAWAQNIDVPEKYIDFMGDRGGIRLEYGSGFTVYTTENDNLVKYSPTIEPRSDMQNQIDAFIRDLDTREKLPSSIDTILSVSRIMQAAYDSSAAHQEIRM